MAVMLIFWLGTSVACWVRVLGGFFPLSVGGFNTFFPDLRKLSLDTLLGKGLKLRGPHSLGTLIEWKRGHGMILLNVVLMVPTRWGH